MFRSTSLPVLVLAFSLCLPGGAAAFTDAKSIPSGVCVPYGPDTTAAELQYGPTTVYNPGTGTEKLRCPLPRDQEDAYVSGDVRIEVYHRMHGSVPQKMTCTLFTGSSSAGPVGVHTTTASGPLVAGDTHAVLFLTAAVQPTYTIVTASSLVCTLPPKVSLGSIVQIEFEPTHEP